MVTYSYGLRSVAVRGACLSLSVLKRKSCLKRCGRGACDFQRLLLLLLMVSGLAGILRKAQLIDLIINEACGHHHRIYEPISLILLSNQHGQERDHLIAETDPCLGIRHCSQNRCQSRHHREQGELLIVYLGYCCS